MLDLIVFFTRWPNKQQIYPLWFGAQLYGTYVSLTKYDRRDSIRCCDVVNCDDGFRSQVAVLLLFYTNEHEQNKFNSNLSEWYLLSRFGFFQSDGCTSSIHNNKLESLSYIFGFRFLLFFWGWVSYKLVYHGFLVESVSPQRAQRKKYLVHCTPADKLNVVVPVIVHMIVDKIQRKYN